jgi:hypothetical protein
VTCAAGEQLVCHVPPGNPANEHEICVGTAAVRAHLAHGDRIPVATCPAGLDCGTISDGCGGTISCGTCTAGQTCTNNQCTGGSGSCHQCACVDLLSAGGCADKCDSAQNGNPNTPNFCNGVSALPQCAACLADRCSSASPTDPSGCM